MIAEYSTAPRFPRLAVFILLFCAHAYSAWSQDLGAIGSSDPIRAGGSVSARTVMYSASEIRGRRQPFSWVLNGTVNVSLYDVDMPFSFTFSEQERSFAQPFNQFGVSPRYQWATGHFGYRNLTFSPYTLSGHQMLGAGFELNPGIVRAGFMYGRFQRAVEEDTAASRFVQPAYERSGFAGKIGVGSGSEFIDLIFLKAKDDPASLRSAPRNSLVLPGENLVLGFTGGATLFGGLRVTLDAAASDYTRDVRAMSIETSNNTHLDAFDALIDQRGSSQFYTAVRGGLAWNAQRWGVGFNYARIDPDYQSMGAYYVGSDIESFSLAPRFILWNGAVRVNANVTQRYDNLQNKKAATTSRLLPMVNVSVQPAPHYGIDVQYSDVLTSQSAGRKPLSDTTRLDSSTPMLTVAPRYSILGTDGTHTFLANVTYQTLNDHNTFSSRYSEYSTTNMHLAYSLSLPKLHWSFTLSGNATQMRNAAGTFRNSGFSLGAGKSLLEQALRLNGSFGMSFHAAGETMTSTIAGTYSVQRRHNFSAQIAHVSSNAGYYAQKTFSEITLVLGYAYTF
ncbi:MAG: hypothetical protein M5R41_10650 [Bacteroidia bacterium]|nr:hypothetical protein [Bacteroidia bacterium]